MENVIELSKRFWVVPFSEGLIIGRGNSSLKKIKGGVVLKEIYASLEQMLNQSSQPIAQLKTELGCKYPLAAVEDVIQVLLKLEVLESKQNVSSNEEIKSDELFEYLHEISSYPKEKYFLLNRATITLCGRGHIAQNLQEKLREYEIGNILSVNDFENEAIEKEVAKSGLIIACADNIVDRYSFFPGINQIALKYNIPWIMASLNGDEAYVGPLFIPHETACYHCLELREENSLPNVSELKKHVSGRWQYYCPAILPSHARFISAAVEMEIFKFITKTSFPSTYQTMLSFDLKTMQCQEHLLLRVPFCDVCGVHVNSPFTKNWNI